MKVGALVRTTIRDDPNPQPALRLVQATTCLSSMALLDSCIRILCTAGTVHTLNRGMLTNLDNQKLILVGLEIFSNFAAAEDDEIDAQATEILLEQGSIETIKAVMDKMYTNESVMRSAFDALYNFSDDAKAAEYLARDGCQILDLALDALITYERNEKMMNTLIKLLSSLMYHPICVRRLRTVCGLSKLLTALAHWNTNATLVDEATMLISNAVTDPDNALALLEQDHLATILSLLDAHTSEESILESVMILLIRASISSDKISIRISETGMLYFMRLAKTHHENVQLITSVYELFGTLAFVEQNIRPIVSQGAVQLLIQTMQHQEEPDLLIKAMNTLETLASADQEVTASRPPTKPTRMHTTHSFLSTPLSIPLFGGAACSIWRL